VDEYVEDLEGWRAEVVAKLREIVAEAAPEAQEAIKWGRPVYSLGGPLCYIMAHEANVNLGFWQGAELEDPEGLLQGTGKKMRHIKLKGMEAVDSQQLSALVRQAVALNRKKGA
jgi:hypothetical protein